MAVHVMAKLDTLVNEGSMLSCGKTRVQIQSELGVSISKSCAHHALKGMMYSVKQVCVEKLAMNSSANQDKVSQLVQQLNDTAI
ncbi:hypothetical protein PybrP1_004612 [[Pythium] brassicae (nom. inval.)]|nr:hypothetical protein PybrP1_004612 [[Pythium] brassicae (nom. inval.)]